MRIKYKLNLEFKEDELSSLYEIKSSLTLDDLLKKVSMKRFDSPILKKEENVIFVDFTKKKPTK